MGLLQRIKHDVKAGWATLRYGTAQAATRALEETELLRLRLEVRKLDQRISELYGDLGERAVELSERGVPAEQVLSDSEIVRVAEQVASLQGDRAKLTVEMDEIRSGS
jgi:hypothetical protein